VFHKDVFIVFLAAQVLKRRLPRWTLLFLKKNSPIFWYYIFHVFFSRGLSIQEECLAKHKDVIDVSLTGELQDSYFEFQFLHFYGNEPNSIKLILLMHTNVKNDVG